MDHPRTGLKYISAKDLDCSKADFRDSTVEDPAGERLGHVEGFILDVDTATPYYAVVNAGGWFRSKHVLIPIGHVALDSDSRKLIADVPKERIRRFPGFDLDWFPQLTKEDLDAMAEEIARACCPDAVIEPDQVISRMEVWAHYRTPVWWDQGFYSPERATGQGGRPMADSKR